MTAQAFDVNFYRQWYKDLASFSSDQANEHWEKFGCKEGRFANYGQLLEDRRSKGLVLPEDFNWIEYIALNGDLPRPSKWGQVQAEMHYLDSGAAERRFYTYSSLLNARKLDPKKLPEKFNWQSYLALNPQLLALYVNSRYLAEVHFLQYGQREGLEYEFDADFYREYNRLVQLEPTFDAALEHYKKVGRSKNLLPSFTPLLKQHGLTASLVPARFDYASYTQLNPAHATQNRYEALLKLLKGDCIDAAPISSQASENLVFYKKLGLHYESSGNDGNAWKAYAAALSWGQDGQLFENIGNIALRVGHKQAAMDWYRRAAVANGHSAHVFLHGTQILRDQSDLTGALALAAQGVLARPSDASAMESCFNTTAQAHWDHVSQTLQPALVMGNRAAVVSEVQQMVCLQFEAHEKLLHPMGRQPVRPNTHGRSVLIIGDHHIPQCVRYRIEQKAEQLQAAGYSVATADWAHASRARELLPWHSVVIFYRVPALPDVIQLMARARSHGKLVFYEVDDLVIDPAFPHPIETYGGQVDIQQYHDLCQGMALMRAAASLCDYGIASTRPLQAALEPLVRQKTCYLHRNGIDSQSMIPLDMPHPQNKGYINLFYGSGTKSHNSDFINEALPAIDRLLTETPALKLTVAGYLAFPVPFLQKHRAQVVQLLHVKNVQAYWSYLGASDINLAVLTPDIITHCKSELKWFEAACFGVPSVVSATQNYLDVIHHGEDGLIAHTPEDWYSQLRTLVDDPAQRTRMGQVARDRVLREYSISHLSKAIDQTIRSAWTHAIKVQERAATKKLHTAT